MPHLYTTVSNSFRTVSRRICTLQFISVQKVLPCRICTCSVWIISIHLILDSTAVSHRYTAISSSFQTIQPCSICTLRYLSYPREYSRVASGHDSIDLLSLSTHTVQPSCICTLQTLSYPGQYSGAVSGHESIDLIPDSTGVLHICTIISISFKKISLCGICALPWRSHSRHCSHVSSVYYSYYLIPDITAV